MVPRLLALSLCLLASCSTLIDDDERQAIRGESPWPRAVVRQAVEDFVGFSLARFPEERGEAARCVAIEFVPHLAYPGLGELSGITDGPCSVRVSTKYTDLLHETALWHELTHAVLWHTYGDPDPTHAEAFGPWTTAHDELVKDLKRTWRARSASLD